MGVESNQSNRMISSSKDNEVIQRKRRCCREKPKNSHRGTHTIRISFSGCYETIVADARQYRASVNAYYQRHPEVFPADFALDYQLHDKQASRKMKGLVIRRIKLSNGQVYQIVPSSIMPYLSGSSQQVSKGLLLRHWAVPYEVIALVLGKNAMYWERQEEALARVSLVGSVCKQSPLPVHLAADEKITFFNGQEAYIALTSSGECVLGGELALQEDTQALQEAYGVFQTEALAYQSSYAPLSVNLDGWPATNLAWKNLFPGISIILCFLHAFLKIKDVARSIKEQFQLVSAQVWVCYQQKTKEDFLLSLTQLAAWAKENITTHERVSAKIQDLCAKAARFAVAYDFEQAYRTSNQVDRPMNLLDRYLYQIRYFKGSRKAANCKVRAWALLYNRRATPFVPFSQRVQKRKENPKKTSRFEEYNGFVYHQDWLQNLLIASSLNATAPNHTIR